MPNEHPKILDNISYPPAGRCIYCGATENLETEHILPFGLSGTAEFPDASCRACAKVTGAFEQKVLRGPLWPVRVFRDLKSRTKHKDAPKTLPLTIVRNDIEEVIQLSLDEYPIPLHFPIFPPPAYWTGETHERGISCTGLETRWFGPHPEDVARSLGATKIKVETAERPGAFARMIAKIGYAFAYAEGAIDDIEGEAFVVPAIRGTGNDIGRWVGTLTKPLETHSDLLYRILVHYDTFKGLLAAEVQLFSDCGTPSYGVILGKLKPNVPI